MVKGITGWIRTHNLIGRSKSEASGPRESRATTKLEDTNRKVTFGPNREISVDMARVANMQPSRRKQSNPATQQEAPPTAKHRRTPPKPSEPPPQPPISNEVAQKAKSGKTRFEQEIDAVIDDGPEQAMEELLDVMLAPDLHQLLTELEVGKIKTPAEVVPPKSSESADDDFVIAELKKELDRLIPDSEEVAVGSTSEAEAGQPVQSTPDRTEATGEAPARDRTASRARTPKPLPKPPSMNTRLKPSEAGQ
jgi:hypothetical protein